jgi:hypothetical protein
MAFLCMFFMGVLMLVFGILSLHKLEDGARGVQVGDIEQVIV